MRFAVLSLIHSTQLLNVQVRALTTSRRAASSIILSKESGGLIPSGYLWSCRKANNKEKLVGR
jgi:hypothetical protein